MEKELLDFNNVYEALNELYAEDSLTEKKQKKGNSNQNNNSQKSWREYFLTIKDMPFSLPNGQFTPLFSTEFAGAFEAFLEIWSSYDISKLVEKLSAAVSSMDISGRPRAVNTEKINGVDHPIFEMKLGETSAHKPIRALYFTKRDEDGSRYVILASLFLHTDKNLSASERNSGRNAYLLANPDKK